MADEEAQAPKRYPSTHELDVEARRKAAAKASSVEPSDTIYAPYAVEGNDVSGYVGVDPMYQTYANEGEKPYASDGGVFAEVEAEAVSAPRTEATEQAVNADDFEGAVKAETTSESNVSPLVAKVVVAKGEELVQPASAAPGQTTTVSKEATEEQTPPAPPAPKKNN